MPHPPNHELLSLRQVADLWQTSTRQIQRLMRSGKLAYVKVGTLVRFRRADLDAFLSANTKIAPGEIEE